MHDVLVALADQHAELAGLLHGLDPEGWHRPTPRCPGWDVADVVLHLVQTDTLALGAARDRLQETVQELADGAPPATGIDDAAEALVAHHRGRVSDGELLQRWETGADELRSVLATADPHARVDWVAGQLSARTLAATRVAESWIHTCDIADALGVTLEPADRLWHVARLAWRTLPYAFARAGTSLHGPVAFELVSPSGAAWAFVPDEAPLTTVRGAAHDLCLVAGRRLDPRASDLTAAGPDAGAVLALVRTYA